MYSSSCRLAIYLRMIYNCGVDRVMINLCQGFIQHGLGVDLVLNTVEGNSNLLSQFPPEVRVVDLKAHHQSKSLSDVMRYLKEECPQALLAAGHYSTEMAVIAKQLTRVPTRVVVSEHSAISKDAQSASWKESKRWIPLAARLTYPWADGVITVSQGVAQDLAKVTGLSVKDIQVIYNPVLTSNLLDKVKQPLDHPWFVPGEPPVILGVGRLEPQKDFANLIQAFARVRQIRPVRLMILGQGGEESKLKHLIHQLQLDDDVKMPGFVQNPYAYMTRSAVFALSSAWEGFGNVLVEAMAAGVPVVSTNCPSGPAEVLDNGRYGILVPVGDPEALAAAILDALAGDRRPVDASWLDQFTVEAVTQKYLNILDIPK